MRRIAIISINGTANMGGVERGVASHRRVLSEVAEVRVFSLPALKLIRKSAVANGLLCASFAVTSGLAARVWAGPDGIVMSHGFSSIGLFSDLTFAHGCWAGYVERTGSKLGRFGRLTFAIEWLSARLARKIVCVSDAVVQQWIRFYRLRPEKSAILLDSIDTNVFFPRQDAIDPCTEDDIRVIFVGRFEHGKGLDTLSKLHAELVRERTRIHLVVCSPTEVKDAVISQFPLFEFHCGLSPQQVATEYSRADLFYLPSLYEAFERSSIESLGCGTPVLLNDTGARPTLDHMACPGLFKLEDGCSPLQSIQLAVKQFRGIKRKMLAAWAHDRFGGANLCEELVALSRSARKAS
jgi:glycosyltransferase involved in cell wall biosynthesis